MPRLPGKTKGRQKIEMIKIMKESSLHCTFTKRRHGLFKKASELSTLCRVEISIVVFSPSGKVFSFGNPSVETVRDRYLTQNPPPPSSRTSELMEAHRNANIRELNSRLTCLENQLDIEKRTGEQLGQMRKKAPFESQGLQQLEQFKAALEVLKNNIREQSKASGGSNANCGIYSSDIFKF